VLAHGWYEVPGYCGTHVSVGSSRTPTRSSLRLHPDLECGQCRLRYRPPARCNARGLNVDGIERLRKKWGSAGRIYYRISEYLATIIPNAIVTDANVIRNYYQKKIRKAVGDDCIRSGLPTDKTTMALDPTGSANRENTFFTLAASEPRK